MTDDNIGRVKNNAEPITNRDFQVPAEEYNQLRLELIETAKLALQLSASGTVGTLQGIYNNGTSSPQRVTADAMRGPVSIKDAATPLGTNLFQIEDKDGNVMSGMGVVAAQLLAKPAGASATQGIVVDTNGTVRVKGASLVPHGGDKTTGLGTASNRMAQLFAGAISGYANVMTYNANMVFDANNNTVFDVALTGAIASIAFANVSEGQIVVVIFRQDATGGRIYNGGNLAVSGIKLQYGEKYFQLSKSPDAIDVFVFIGNYWSGNKGGNVIEICRYQQEPLEQRTDSIDLATSGTISLYPHISLAGYYNVGSTGMTGDVTYDLIGTGYARSGDEVTFYFGGITLNGGHNLIFKGDGSPLKTYNANKTLTGGLRFVYLGGAWRAFDGDLTAV